MCTCISPSVSREKNLTAEVHTHQVNPSAMGLPLRKMMITSSERPWQRCCALMLSLIPPVSASAPLRLMLQRISGLCLES